MKPVPPRALSRKAVFPQPLSRQALSGKALSRQALSRDALSRKALSRKALSRQALSWKALSLPDALLFAKPTSHPVGIEPNGEFVTCVSRKSVNFVAIAALAGAVAGPRRTPPHGGEARA